MKKNLKYCLLSCSLVSFGVFAADEVDMGVDGPNSVPIRPQTGKLLRCRDEEHVKRDYLRQLQSQEIYGNPARMANERIARAARYYQENNARNFSSGKSPLLAPNLFENLSTAKLFNGAKTLRPETPASEIPQPGDILLNTSFINPWTIGSFYSKRGMIHARIVVGTEVVGKELNLVLLDGGWKKFSKLSQVHSQSLWLRPKRKFFGREERLNLIKWAKVMEPVPYDNRLLDDLVQYREIMHSALDRFAQDDDGDGQPNLEPRAAQVLARQMALRASLEGNFAPFGDPDTYVPESGNYCSEAGTHIFSYNGFRQFGETAFSLVTAFSPHGNLPQWAVYENALTGFGASQGPVYAMHQAFFSYFSLMDAAWKKHLLALPEGYTGTEYNFAKVMRLNQDLARNSALSQTEPRPDPLDEQLLTLINSTDADIARSATELRPQLQGLVTEMRSTYQDPSLNLTLAVDKMYFDNLSYGPHHFLENGERYELIGAFYNTDLKGGYQAKWVASAGPEDDRHNISTTLYDIDPSTVSNEPDTCEVTNIQMDPLTTKP